MFSRLSLNFVSLIFRDNYSRFAFYVKRIDDAIVRSFMYFYTFMGSHFFTYYHKDIL